MQDLLSEDRDIRKKRLDELKDLVQSDISSFSTHIPELLSVIEQSTDQYLPINVASLITQANGISPILSETYIETIFNTVMNISKIENISDTPRDQALSILFSMYSGKLNDMSFSKNWLHVFFQLLNSEVKAKHIAVSPLTIIGTQNPRLLVEYVDEIFKLLKSGNNSLASSLMFLYKFKPEIFEENLTTFIELYKSDQMYKSIYLQIIGEIAKKRGELISPYLDNFIDDIDSPTYSTLIAMMMQEVASKDPVSISKYVVQLTEASKYNDYLVYYVPNILGYVGRLSIEKAKEVLPLIDSMRANANDNGLAMILSEFRNLAEMDKQLLEPYLDMIKEYENNPQENVRDQAKLIV
ncbi:MAG: hypothetical protein OEZ01_15270, partial [Candidatus Heimdallarchaeota archaeon]|nr:hypothetical protein [Candidatus Heimdallarchaeota archaeon]